MEEEKFIIKHCDCEEVEHFERCGVCQFENKDNKGKPKQCKEKYFNCFRHSIHIESYCNEMCIK